MKTLDPILIILYLQKLFLYFEICFHILKFFIFNPIYNYVCSYYVAQLQFTPLLFHLHFFMYYYLLLYSFYTL